MSSNLFVHPEYLIEGKKVSLSKAQSADSKRLQKRLESLTDKRENSVIALIGNFGSGKTTVLESVEEKLSTDFEWINFDVWRYADRQQIWDGFVIEVASALGQMDEEVAAENVEGKAGFKLWVLKHKMLSIANAAIIWVIVSYLLWTIGNLNQFLEALLKYGTSAIFALLLLLGISTVFSEQKPLKRIFQLENYLLSMINVSTKPVVIVVEDVDRAGLEGLVFMETLSRFFAKNQLENTVVVIAPQSKAHFKVHELGALEGFERGIKIYDSIMYFAASELSVDEGVHIIEQAEISKHYQQNSELFFSTARTLLNSYASYVSMRTFKFILREVDEYVAAYPSANPSIALSLIFSRYILISTSQQGRYVEGSTILQKNGQISAISYPSSGALLQAIAFVAGASKGSQFTNIQYLEMEEEITAESRHSTTSIKLSSRYQDLVR